MGNSFDASLNMTAGPTSSNDSYWAQVAAQSQRPQANSETVKQPWMPPEDTTATTNAPAERHAADSTRTPEAPPAVQAQKDPFELINAAEASFAQHGMTDETKKLFQGAITVADAAFNPQDVKVLQTLADALVTGKKIDGTAISQEESFRGHQILNAELRTAQLGVQIRLEYANMLKQTNQLASAQTVLKDSIKMADQLPQDLIKKESQTLKRDMADLSKSREQQILLGELQKDYAGDHTLKQPGFAYLPTLTRLATAAFYVSAEPRPDGKTPNGVLKPEIALSMLNDAKTAYQRDFNSDITKKGADATYDAIAGKANEMLPENLAKAKSNADGIWSNQLIDLGIGAAVIGGVGLLTRNPALVEAGLAAAEGGLTVSGKVVAAGLMVGGATAGRHYGKELLTGSSESWLDSAIHGTAGLAEIGLIVGTRSKLSSALYKGADAESALLRVAEVKGTAGTLTSGALKEIYAANKWAIPSNLSALEASTVIVKDGALVKSVDLGLDAAKSAELTQAALAGPQKGLLTRGAKFVWQLPSNLASTVTGLVNPRELDLATATAKQLAWKGSLSNYASALTGVEGYQAITSLDRPYDLNNGGKVSYAQSFADNVFSTTPLVDALMIMPFLKAGGIPRNLYQEGAGPIKNAVSSVKSAFSTLGPQGALANSENAFTRAALTAVPVAGGTSGIWQLNANRELANKYQDLINQEQGH